MSSPQAFTRGFVMRASRAQEPAHDTRRRPPFRAPPWRAPLCLALPRQRGRQRGNPAFPRRPAGTAGPAAGASDGGRPWAGHGGVRPRHAPLLSNARRLAHRLPRPPRGRRSPALAQHAGLGEPHRPARGLGARRVARRQGWVGGTTNCRCHGRVDARALSATESPKTRTLETHWMETDTFAPAYELPSWPFEPPPELGGSAIRRHPIVIVGPGLAGLTLACDLAQRGVRAVLLDEDDTVGVRGASSRGICYAQKSLEIFERLGLYRRVADKGITWSFGRTFSGETEVYNFNLQTGSVSAQPPFINLQQFYVEWFLVDRILELGLTDVRWKNRATHVEPLADGARLEIETPAGAYAMETDYLIDASGANSPIRTQLGLEAHASRSTDRWCISAVRFKKTIPVAHSTFVD